MLLIIMCIGWLLKFTLTNLHCNLDIVDFLQTSYSIYAGEESQLPLMQIRVPDSCRADIQKLELIAIDYVSGEEVDSGLFSLNEEQAAVVVRPIVTDIGKYSLSVNACFNTGDGECMEGKGAVVEIIED